MTINYDLYRMNQNLCGSTLTQEELRQWIFNNIFIIKIGMIKSFDPDSQKGVVVIKEFDNLEIETQNISNINIKPNEGEMVLLLQSNINLFSQDDDINFDKNHFYILSIINPKYLELACNDVHIQTINKVDIKSDNYIDINAKHNININCYDLGIKAKDDVNIQATDDIDINSSYNLDLTGRNRVLIKSNNKIDIRNNSESLRSILIDITYAINSLRVTGQAVIDESSRAGLYALRSRIYDLLD
ncbi:Hypothetical protein BHY_1285 (plasmid) [Borrelia nietonii YOR]|uniref:Uncharacterized protein n=1 Tax=Borrelia nietonii YOR TaxID=1293576 RepID=W5SGH9_9SPIR|nr:DUF777 family protein [Borrelia nietonii]AHH04236.1 Hypothetical protein BHY_1285 [Borrelia nietonii YOR]